MIYLEAFYPGDAEMKIAHNLPKSEKKISNRWAHKMYKYQHVTINYIIKYFILTDNFNKANPDILSKV